MRVDGITHVAIECSSPTRMERYLRDTFGLQLLRVGYWKGEYVRVVGSPHDQRVNSGLVHLYNRPFIPRGRLRYVALGTRDWSVEDAVGELRGGGYYDIDGEDVLSGPDGLRVKIDSFAAPRALRSADPSTTMVDVQVDPDLPCLVRGIHHVAYDVPDSPNTLAWLSAAFEYDALSCHDRRGERIDIPYYETGPRDVMGRRMASLALFRREGATLTELNHIAFDMADAEGAISAVESSGSVVDLEQDAMIQGPEEIWYQIDSFTTPFPVDHPANPTGVTLIPYGRHLRRDPRYPALGGDK